MFKDRSVIEIMVLWFTFIIGFILLGMGALISIVKIKSPSTNLDRATDALFAVITLILGALLGMLSAKTTMVDDLHKRPDRDVDGL